MVPISGCRPVDTQCPRRNTPSCRDVPSGAGKELCSSCCSRWRRYDPPRSRQGCLLFAARGYWSPTITAFAERFPSLSLNLTTELSKYDDARIDRAFYDQNNTVDIAALQTLHDYPRWKAQNRLMFYKPHNFSDIVNGEKDFDGAYLPLALCESFQADS